MNAVVGEIHMLVGNYACVCVLLCAALQGGTMLCKGFCADLQGGGDDAVQRRSKQMSCVGERHDQSEGDQ